MAKAVLTDLYSELASWAVAIGLDPAASAIGNLAQIVAIFGGDPALTVNSPAGRLFDELLIINDLEPTNSEDVDRQIASLAAYLGVSGGSTAGALAAIGSVWTDPGPFITVTQPTSSTEWGLGTSAQVRWASNLTGDVSIQLSVNEGEFEEIGTAQAEERAWTWPVVEADEGSAVVRVVHADAEDDSATFTITTVPYLVVTAPTLGADWPIDSIQDIEWATNRTGPVNIYVRRNGGAPTLIDSALAEDGAYSWQVTGPEASATLVVTHPGSGLSANSAAFTISAALDTFANVIWIVLDDFGPENFPWYEPTDREMPTVTAIADDLLRFDAHHVAPQCTATRLGMMTGYRNNINYVDFGVWPDAEIPVTKMVHDAGIKTCMTGKWQFDWVAGGDGPALPSEARMGLDWYNLNNFDADPDPRYINGKIKRKNLTTGLEEDITAGSGSPVVHASGTHTQYGIDFMEKCRLAGDRFFWVNAEMLPHQPFQRTPDHPQWNQVGLNMLAENVAYFPSMVEYIDTLLGQILAYLESSGLINNTLILITGDNGNDADVTTVQGNPAYSIAGKKARLDRHGSNVPMLAYCPGRVDPGVIRAPVENVDIVATTLDALGVAQPSPAGMPHGPWQSVSYYNLILDNTDTPSRTYGLIDYEPRFGIEYPGAFAYDGQYKLYGPSWDGSLYKNGQMFDYLNDPRELVNVAAEPALAEIKAALQNVLDNRFSTITFTAPASGANWAIGSEQDIEWEVAGITGAAALELKRGAGSWTSVATIEDVTAGLYTWTVTSPVASCQFRLVHSLAIGTSATFNIVNAALTITEPDPSDVYYIDDTLDIAWTTNQNLGDVTIQLARDGVTYSETIDTEAVTAGTYAWIVTGPVAPAAKIRIVHPNVTGTMSGAFSIAEAVAGAVTVLSPVADQQIGYLDPLNVSWLTDLAGPYTVEIDDGLGGWDELDAVSDDTHLLVSPLAYGGPRDATIRVTADNGGDPVSGISDTFRLVTFAADTFTDTGDTDIELHNADFPVDTIWTSTSGTGIINDTNEFTESAAVTGVDGAYHASASGVNAVSVEFEYSSLATDNQPGAMIRGTNWLNCLWAGYWGQNELLRIAERVAGVNEVLASSAVTLSTGVVYTLTFELIDARNARVTVNPGGHTLTATKPAEDFVHLTDYSAGLRTTQSAGEVGLFDNYSAAEALTPDAGSLTVVSPDTGDTWLAATTQKIAWASNLSAGTVTIKLARDGVTFDETLDTAPAVDGVYEWLVTGPDAPAAKIRVDAGGGVSDDSAAFAIGGTVEGLTVLTPLPGVEKSYTDALNVSWSTTAVGPYTVEINDGVGGWIELGVEPTEHFYNVAELAQGGPRDAVVRVTAANGGDPVSGTSDAFRLITALYDSFTASNGTLLSAHSPDYAETGTVWTSTSAASVVYDNSAASTTTDTTPPAGIHHALTTACTRFQHTWLCTAFNSNNTVPGIMIRGTNWSNCLAVQFLNNQQAIRLVDIISGSAVSLAEAAWSPSANTEYTIVVEIPDDSHVNVTVIGGPTIEYDHGSTLPRYSDLRTGVRLNSASNYTNRHRYVHAME